MDTILICSNVAIMAISIPTDETKLPERASFVLFIILIPMMNNTEAIRYKT
jgi:hypothetical protein